MAPTLAAVGRWQPSCVLVLGAAPHLDRLTDRPGVKALLAGGHPRCGGVQVLGGHPARPGRLHAPRPGRLVTLGHGAVALAVRVPWRARLNLMGVVLAGGALGLARAFLL